MQTRRSFVAAALAVALLAHPAQAADVTMTLSWPGGSTGPIDYLHPLAQPGSLSDSLTIDTSLLNTFLGGNGSGYSFSTLGASSFPGGPTAAVLSTTGEAMLSGPGSNVITISTALGDYIAPTGPAGMLRSLATALFTATPVGDSQSSSTSFNGVQAGTFLLASDGTSPNSASLPAVNSAVGPVSPLFELSNSSTITLSRLGAKDQFAVSQVLTTPIPGDANVDGKVDVADLGILASNWQSTGLDWCGADFTGEGVVDVADLGILASYWQEGVGSPGSIDAGLAPLLASHGLLASAVPEPGAGMGVIGLTVLARFRLRRGGRRRGKSLKPA